jgi:radical SAM superfamily enzyme YgiQ (UPF0313 family)
MSRLDLLLVNAPGKAQVYQSLASDLAAYEPPIWATIIAGYARRAGLGVDILDAEALRMTVDETAQAIVDRGARLTVFTVYGQQPSASTQCMPAAGAVARQVKALDPTCPTLFMGTHPSALPERTLLEEATDFVCEGEGPATIVVLLEALGTASPALDRVPGLWYKDGLFTRHSAAAPIAKDLSTLAGMAWDLLPMASYRAHNWHCFDHPEHRDGYASIYTSFGCPYRCTFCCINAPFGGSGIRYFSPEVIIQEIDVLVQRYGVRNLKIADEMFVLNQNHVLGLCDLLIERNYGLNIWAYARIDTVHEKFLDKLKRAGFNWLGIGIESASKFVRDGVEKGRFTDEKIAGIVRRIREAGIHVGANYIFGLPDDTLETMQGTLDLALELNTEWANFYSAMAYPGSALHATATAQNVMLPESPGGPGWIGYSQHAYETLPLPTATVPAGAVLSFRDHAFDTYFQSDRYCRMMRETFGQAALDDVIAMSQHTLRRKYATPFEDCRQPAAVLAR